MAFSIKLTTLKNIIKKYYPIIISCLIFIIACIFIFSNMNKSIIIKGKTFEQVQLENSITEIVFCFDQDMIQFSDYDQSIQAWQKALDLSFSPNITGTIRTINSKKFIFILDTFQNKDFTIYYKKNLISLTGKPVSISINHNKNISNPYIFKTETPIISYASRFQEDLSSPIILFFSQPIKLKELKPSISLIQDNNNKQTTFKIQYQITTNQINQNRLCISTNYQSIYIFPNHLKKHNSYTLTVDYNILYPNTFKENFVYNFATYSSPRWLGLGKDSFTPIEKLTEKTSIPLILPVNQSFWLKNNTMIKIPNNSTNSILKITPLVSNLTYAIYESGIKITGDFRGNQKYDLSFTPINIKDKFNQPITNTYTTNFTTQHQPPEIQQVQNTIYIDRNNPIIPFQTINVTNVIIKYQLINSAYYAAVSLYGKDVPVNTYTTNITIDSPIDQITWNTFDLSNIISNQTMIVLINIQDKDRPTQNKNFTKVLPTSSGIFAHISTTDMILQAYDINTLAPHEDMMISIWDPVRNSLQDLGKTKSDGILRIPNPKLPIQALSNAIFIGIYENPKHFNKIAFLSRHSTDFSGINNSTYFYNSPRLSYNNINTTDTIRSMIFTDRPNYNPNEKVYIHAIARKKNNNQFSTKDPFFSKNAQIQVHDPNYNLVTNVTKNWSSFGSIGIYLAENQTKLPGTYSVSIKSDNDFSDYTYFNVYSLNPKNIEIEFSALQHNLTFENKLNFSLKSQFLFGETFPSIIHYSISSTSFIFNSSKYPYYHFGEDTAITPLRSYLPLTKFLFNGKVKTTINKPIINISKNLKNQNQNIQLQIIADVVSQKNKSISMTNNDIIVYQPIQLGIYTKKMTVTNNEEMLFNIISIDPITEQIISNKQISLHIQKDEPINLGKLSFITNIIPLNLIFPKIVYTKILNSGYNSFHFTPKTSGTYRLIIYTHSNNKKIQSSLSFMVIGQQDIIESNELRLELDNTIYKSGDTTLLHIDNPFSQANLMLTIDRDNIREYYSTNIIKSLFTYPIVITAQDEPGIHISATLTSISNQQYNKVLFGEKSIKILPINKQLTIDAKTSKSNYAPKETVDIEISAYLSTIHRINGEAVIIIRDKAVLNPILSTIPNPIDYFYSNREYNFTTWNSGYSLLEAKKLTNYKAPPIARPLTTRLANAQPNNISTFATPIKTEVSIRSNFPNTIYYNNTVKLYSNKKTKISFELPDNISGFDVSIIAYDDASYFGQTNFTITSSKKFMIDPIIPKFIRPNDHVTWGAYIRNFTSLPIKAQVILENSSSYLNKQISIPNNSYILITNTSYISNALKSWNITAYTSNDQDQLLFNIPIVTNNPWIYSSTSGYSIGYTNIILSTPQSNTIEQSLTIELTKNPIIQVKNNINTILSSENLYINNIIARILLFAGNEDLFLTNKFINIDKHQLTNKIQNDINLLYSYYKDQNSMYSTPSKEFTISDPILILDVYNSLIRAQKNNYYINQTFYSNIIKIAQTFSRSMKNATINQSLAQAYAINLLAIDNKIDTETFKNIYPTLPNISSIQALILNTMHVLGFSLPDISKQTKNILRFTSESGNNIIIKDDNTRFISPTLIKYYGTQEDGIKILNGLKNRNNNIEAYVEFSKKYNLSPNFLTTIQVNKQKYNFDQTNTTITIPIITHEVSIDITNTDIFYYISYGYIPKNIDNEYNNSYNIEKRIYSASDKEQNIVDSLKYGEEYILELIINPKNINISQKIEIIDPLYAGLEVLPIDQQPYLKNISYFHYNDKLHFYTQVRNSTTIKYLVRAQIYGSWTAPPIAVYTLGSLENFSFKKQEVINIQ